MSRELIAQLRAELAQLNGPARLPGLVKLGQALMAECYRIGPGTAGSKPDLDASIEVFDEAYGYLDVGDPVRGPVAGLLGIQLTARHGVHGWAERDRETGIQVLEEALSFSGLPVSLRAMSRLALGHLYLARVMERVMEYVRGAATSTGARAADGAAVDALSDAERASACVRPLIDGEPVSDEFTTGARTLLELIDAVRAWVGVMGGDLAGVDLNRLIGAMAKLQELWGRMRQQPGPAGYRLPATDLLSLDGSFRPPVDPLDRPVAVVQGEQPADETTPPIERPAPPPPPDAAELRRSLHTLLPPMTGGDQEAIWLSGAELLRPETPKPDAATIDEMVALASTLVELGSRPETAGGPDRVDGSDPAMTAIDGYLLAVALLLRDRTDEHSDGADRRAGVEELLSAARTIPLDHPAAIVILRSLGAFLSETKPMDGVVAAVAGKYADRLDCAIAAGVAEPADLVTLHALRCLCRVAEAFAELRRATGTVPTEYPWLAPIKAAGELAESTIG